MMAARTAPSFHPTGMMRAEAHIGNLDVYHMLYERSVADPAGFWAEHALRIPWFRPWDRILDWNFTEPRIEWFVEERKPEQLLEFLEKAGYVAGEIAAGRFYKRPGRWCSWCDFLPVCLGDQKAAEETLVRV